MNSQKREKRVTKNHVILYGVCWCVWVFYLLFIYLFFFYFFLAHDAQASTMARSGCRSSALFHAFSRLDPLRHSRLARRSTACLSVSSIFSPTACVPVLASFHFLFCLRQQQRAKKDKRRFRGQDKRTKMAKRVATRASSVH